MVYTHTKLFTATVKNWKCGNRTALI